MQRPVLNLLRSLLFLLIFILMGLPLSSKGEDNQQVFKRDLPVELIADFVSYDSASDTYSAKGNVVITQGTTTLKSDSATINLKSGAAAAGGGFEFKDEGGNIMSGQGITIDIKEKTAVVAKGRIFFKKNNIHVTGDAIKKTGAESYAAENAAYTSCDCAEGASPAWRFSVKDASVIVGEYLTGRDAFFLIKDWPAFYTPYLKVPVNRERQSGILAPAIGYSGLRGLVLENSFFWARSINTDATFYLDIETLRGAGEGVEYRYIRKKDSSGEIFFYHFAEDDIERVREFRQDSENLGRPESGGDSRWQFIFKHTETLGDGFNIKANINRTSDDEYLLDFGDTASERSLESLESNISLSKSWSSLSLVAQFRVFDNLTEEDDSETLQKLPEITLSSTDQRILNTPFYLSLESSYIVFSRDEADAGTRLDMHPRLSMPLKAGGYVELTPYLAPRATLYSVSGDPDDGYAERYLYDAGIDATTTFVRVFDIEFKNLNAVKHTVRPKLSYLYIPEAVQDELPYFDSIDSISASNAITYSVNTTLTGKFPEDGKTSYEEFFYLDLSQSYSINEATRGITSSDDERRPFSDLKGEIRLKPAGLVNITAKGEFDVYESWFTSYDASVSIEDKRGDGLAVSQRFLRDSSRYFEASLKARISGPLSFNFIKRLSSEDADTSLETSYGIEYAHQCWTGTLKYTDRLDENLIMLTFDLLGIGHIGGIETSLSGM